MAGHLADHEIHQADFGRAGHGRAGLHRHGRQVMAIDGRAAGADHLGIGKRRQRLGVELGHRRHGRGRGVRPAKNEGRAQNRLVAAVEGAHRRQHGFIPDKRRIAVAVAGHDSMRFHVVGAKQDGAHIQHIFGIAARCGHPHEGLVGIEHRGMGDAKMAVRDRVVHRLDNMVSRGMHRRQHVRQLVKGRQIVQRRRAAHILKVAKIGRACHRDEDRLPPAKRHGLVRVAGMKRDLRRDGPDQRFHQPAVEMHPLAAHIGAGALPVPERDVVAEDNADLFKNIKRSGINTLDLFLVHRFGQRQPAGQGRQHRMIGAGAQVAALASSAAPPCIRCDSLVHEFASFIRSCH